MKVLFLASYFPKPDNPVMGTWALSQAQALVRQGIDLQVISFTSWVPKAIAFTPGAKAYAHCPKEYIWENNVQVLYPHWLYYPVNPIKRWMYKNPEPYLKLAYCSARQKLLQIIQQFQPDILFCHHSLPNGWIVSHLSKELQLPVITSDYDFDEISDCIYYPLRRKALEYVTKNVDLMLCAAYRMEENIKEQFPQANTETIHHAITLLSNQILTNPPPESFAKHTIILSCALFAERKGVPLLIKAFDKIAARYPNAILRIIGDGPEAARVRETVTKLNLKDRVQLLGKQSHDRVLQEMVWADCFALVGWDEPFATVYLEAMAAGKPIICCNDGGINDVIQDGIHGLTVPPKDVEATANALEQMLKNPEQRQKMGKEAKKLIERSLTWDAKAKELIHRFEETLAQSSQSESSLHYEHI